MSQRLFGATLIIVFVIAALLDVTGVAPGAGVQALPFLLLLVAAYVVLRNVVPGRSASVTSDLSIPAEGAHTASLELVFGAGDLRVETSAGAESLIAGQCVGDVSQKVRRAEGGADITLRQPLSFLGRKRADWQVKLSQQATWQQVRLELGASDDVLLLDGLHVEDLSIETGGSSLEATLPRAGKVLLYIGGGRATLRVPVGAAAEIRNFIRLGQVNVEETRFLPGEPEHWATAAVDSAPEVLHITLKGGLGTVEVVSA